MTLSRDFSGSGSYQTSIGSNSDGDGDDDDDNNIAGGVEQGHNSILIKFYYWVGRQLVLEVL